MGSLKRSDKAALRWDAHEDLGACLVKCTAAGREAGFCGEITMEMQIQDEHEPAFSSAVKATFGLGSETHTIEACKGILSDQLVFVKGESMNILKEFITKHNVPNDVPDEILSEDDSNDDGEAPAVKSKKLRTENN
ncbi:hypothetical protein QVD17_16956 [Tagetes erecta]|uniref:Uncharacterized protein n=1 Tax=Tagetes erecta TaxID=13708 RepID=A0AAD8KSA7_TARER|nr:hypothetical protein QVD17_16956 [Tagetes erecta]